MSPTDTAPAEVFVLSDGTGETGSAAVRAAMAQFPNPWRLRLFGDIRHPEDVRRVIARAAEADALVVFTLVDQRTTSALIEEARATGVVAVDIVGPLIAEIAKRLQAEPRRKPGLLHAFSDEYFERVEAVEFAVLHDDGANLHTLFEADIVLTGVSRTSKTPLSMYLAQKGFKTGNVPLVPGLDPPRPLLELGSRKVFGLWVDPATLLTVRKARLRALGAAPHSAYTNIEAVELELDRARRLFREMGWRSLDISGRAVEENASRILELYLQDSSSAC